MDLRPVVWCLSSAARHFCGAVCRGGRRCDSPPGAVLVAAADRTCATQPQAAEPAALPTSILRPAAVAPGLGSGGRPLGLVEHVLRLYADLRGDLRAHP